MSLFKIAASIDEIAFQKSGLCRFCVGEKNITLAKKGDRLFAFAEKCPHSGNQLAEGYLDAHNCVVCPLHSYRFNLSNGFNVSGEGYRLKIYKTHKLQDGWFIEID